MEFLYRVVPTRPAMLTEGPTAEEEARIGEHFAYLQRLAAEGVLELAGRTVDTGERTFGIALFRAEDADAARLVMEQDPAVAGGVMAAELFPFRTAVRSEG